MFDFRIFTFMEVCKTKNYTKAAEHLCITQPAVSKHIQYLEDYFKVQLFSYAGKKISITKEGYLLYKAANTMLCDEALLKQQMLESNKQIKKLSFGVTLTIGEFVIGDCIREYSQKHNTENISMQVNNTKELLDKLESGEIEFAMIEGAIERDKFECELFTTEEFIAVCARNYSFKQKVSHIQDLIGEHMIIREPGSGSREIFMQTLKERDIPLESFEKVTEMGSIHLLKEMVMEKEGITFLYKAAVKKELMQKQLKIIPLKDFKLFHDFTFVWRKNSIFREEYRQILKEFKEIYERSLVTEPL